MPLSDDRGHHGVIEKDRKEKAKAKAEKKAAKEAKFGQGESDSDASKKKVYRRKGESRLVAERKAKKEDTGVKKTGRIIVTSKRATTKEDNEY